MLGRMIVGGGVIAGVLLAMLFSQVVAMGRSPNQPLASSKTEQAQRQIPPTKIVSLREKQLQAQKHEPDCEKSEKREDCFLGLRAVWAAEAQAKGAVDQADYTWWGLLVLGFTLVATGIAARAAWRTVRVMKDTGERQLRAYVTIVDAHMRPHTVNGQPSIEVFVRLKNSGQTPGYQFSTWSDRKIDATTARPFAQAPPLAQRAGASIIGPGSTVDMTLYVIGVDAATTQDLLQGRKRIFAWGRADYVDIFGKDRYFEFKGWNGANFTNNMWGMSPHPEGYKAN